MSGSVLTPLQTRLPLRPSFVNSLGASHVVSLGASLGEPHEIPADISTEGPTEWSTEGPTKRATGISVGNFVETLTEDLETVVVGTPQSRFRPNRGLFDLPAGVRRGLARSEAPAAWKLSAFAGRFSEISGGRAGAPLTLLFRLILEAQKAGEPVAWIGREDSVFFPPDAADAGIDLEAMAVIHTKGLHATSAARAADRLLRSGAFGMVVMDLGPQRAARFGDLHTSYDPGRHDSGQEVHDEEARRERIRRNGTHKVLSGAMAGAIRTSGGGASRGHRLPGVQRLPLHIQTRLVGLAKKHGAALICLTEKEDKDPSLGSLISLRAQVERAERIGDRYRCKVHILKDKRRGPGWVHQEVCRGPDGLC